MNGPKVGDSRPGQLGEVPPARHTCESPKRAISELLLRGYRESLKDINKDKSKRDEERAKKKDARDAEATANYALEIAAPRDSVPPTSRSVGWSGGVLGVPSRSLGAVTRGLHAEIIFAFLHFIKEIHGRP